MTSRTPRAAAHSLSPRQRLLAAAEELFYSEGVHVVGIDRIVERAGVAKASLYSIFGSKDELVRVYLEDHFRQRQERIADILASHDTPRDRILAVFAEIEGALDQTKWRGCRFINASAEARPGGPTEAVSEHYRAWLRSVFTDLARAAGAGKPKETGRQLHLLYDGAAIAARMDEDRHGAATAMRSAVVALLDSAVRAKRART